MEQTRTATQAGAAAMADLAAIRREQYARYQPVFWRPATGVPGQHRAYLASLAGNETVITLVSDQDGEVTGFLIATLTGAPGVFDPGGPTCQINDFVVVPRTDGRARASSCCAPAWPPPVRAAPSRPGTWTSPSARRWPLAAWKSPPNGG